MIVALAALGRGSTSGLRWARACAIPPLANVFDTRRCFGVAEEAMTSC